MLNMTLEILIRTDTIIQVIVEDVDTVLLSGQELRRVKVRPYIFGARE